MGQFSSFDNPETKAFTTARQDFLGHLLNAVQHETELTTALDVGCGLGDFARFLADRGLKVLGLDGREENVKEASNRHPEIRFLTQSAEELPTKDLGKFDLVLCFGLLYHLENPFRVVRSLHAVTGKILLIEGICLPDPNPTMSLMDEYTAENQGLNYVAFYPSVACLAKMVYRAGFPHVYSFTKLPDFHLYRASVLRKQERTLLAASMFPLKIPEFIVENDPSNWASNPPDPWTTTFSRLTNPVSGLRDFTIIRLPRFLKKPWSEKRQVLSRYLKREGI